MKKKWNNVFFKSAIILIIAWVVSNVLFNGIGDLLLSTDSLLSTSQALLVLDILQLYTRVGVLLIVIYIASRKIRNKSLADGTSEDIVANSNQTDLTKFILFGYVPYLLIATVVLIFYSSTLVVRLLNEVSIASITITYLYQVVTGSRISIRTIAIYASIAAGLAVGDYALIKLFWIVVAWAEGSITDYSVATNIIIIASKMYGILNVLWSIISIVIKVKVLSKLLPIHSDNLLTTE